MFPSMAKHRQSQGYPSIWKKDPHPGFTRPFHIEHARTSIRQGYSPPHPQHIWYARDLITTPSSRSLGMHRPARGPAGSGYLGRCATVYISPTFPLPRSQGSIHTRQKITRTKWPPKRRKKRFPSKCASSRITPSMQRKLRRRWPSSTHCRSGRPSSCIQRLSDGPCTSAWE